MSWNLALEINKLVSITRVSGSNILIYNSTGTLLASYKTTGLFLGDADTGGSSSGTNSFVAPSYGTFTFGGQFANPPKILSGGGASLYYRGAGHNFENYLGTLGAQVNTGAIVASGNISSTGSINVASVVSTGAISGTTITGTGAISGASVVSTGAISGTTISGTTITSTSGILCNDYSNNGNNNLNITAFSSGNNPAITFNSGSSNSATASGRWGYLNNTGWVFENGNSSTNTTIAQIKADTTGGSPILLITGTTTGANHTGIQVIQACNQYQNSIRLQAGAGIGITTTIYHMEFSYNGSLTANISQLGSLVTYGQPSDRRLKENIDYNYNATDILNQLKPVSYNFIGQDRTYHGFIAQDILEVVPQYVAKGTDDFYQIDYSKFTGILCKAVQEQHAKITSLEAQLASLKATVDALVAQKEILVV